MDVKLYQAALRGNVSLLTQLLQENPELLVQTLKDCTAKNNPLHIAARLGHSNFVREILEGQPQFASELNSKGQAPLHLASAKGHLEVLKELLKAYPNACYLHDRDGTTPLHRAAMNGRLNVLKELVDADKKTAWLLTDQGTPILHLCVHHNQFEALKELVKAVSSVEFVNLKDDVDNTILHLLASENQHEVVEFLLNNEEGVNVNVVNVAGLSALDVTRKNPSGSNRRKIWASLKNSGAKRAREISPTSSKKRAQKIQNEKYKNWLSAMKESLMVAATLMASMAFQAALNPPGGVWQEYGYHNSTSYHDPNFPQEQIPHRAGEAVISYTLPGHYKAFTLCTALGLLASLSLILLLVSGFYFQRKISIYILMVATWIAVASIMATYLFSYFSLTPPEVIDSKKFWIAVPGVISMWFLLVCTVSSVYIYRRRFLLQPVVKKFLCKLCHQTT